MLTRRLAAVRVPALAFALALSATACDDPFSAFLRDVPETPSEATLFDFISGRLQDPPAFDVIRETTVRVDQTHQWDFLFRLRDGTPELVPYSVATDSVTQAGLRRAQTTFEGVLEAPRGGYETAAAMPIAEGDVLIARSRQDRTQLLICNRFAKLEILDLDAAAATVTFRFLANPNCGDTVLEPGKHGKL